MINTWICVIYLFEKVNSSNRNSQFVGFTRSGLKSRLRDGGAFPALTVVFISMGLFEVNNFVLGKILRSA